MGWTSLTEDQKADFYRRYKSHDTSIVALAGEAGVPNPSSLERQLRNWAQKKREAEVSIDEPSQDGEKKSSPNSTKAPATLRDLPSADELFLLVKKEPRTMQELCEIFDRSEASIRLAVDQARSIGYVIQEELNTISFQKGIRPHAAAPVKTLADEYGQQIVFAAVSDSHAGSIAAQPTARRRFLDIAYSEYGARVFLDPGDSTTGVRGYRGQEYDVVPGLRRVWNNPAAVALGEVWLYDKYTPFYEDAQFYMLGGNHDYWSITNAGIDPIYAICQQRFDHTYLGYDMADIPLTDKVDLRLWHPGGGGGNNLSTKLQQGLTAAAVSELRRAAEHETNPRLRFLLAGHLHIECKISLGHMVAAHVGCFEGTTNYLKRLGKTPQIGGAIFKVRLTDGGLIQRVQYDFIPFSEIKDDWQNWPIPPEEEADEVMHEPDMVQVIFKGIHSPGDAT